jgi:hypothetical protein
MHYFALWNVPSLPTRALGIQTVIDVVEIGVKAFVQCADLPNHVASNDHAGTGRPNRPLLARREWGVLSTNVQAAARQMPIRRPSSNSLAIPGKAKRRTLHGCRRDSSFGYRQSQHEDAQSMNFTRDSKAPGKMSVSAFSRRKYSGQSGDLSQSLMMTLLPPGKPAIRRHGSQLDPGAPTISVNRISQSLLCVTPSPVLTDGHLCARNTRNLSHQRAQAVDGQIRDAIIQNHDQ